MASAAAAAAAAVFAKKQAEDDDADRLSCDDEEEALAREKPSQKPSSQQRPPETAPPPQPAQERSRLAARLTRSLASASGLGGKRPGTAYGAEFGAILACYEAGAVKRGSHGRTDAAHPHRQPGRHARSSYVGELNRFRYMPIRGFGEQALRKLHRERHPHDETWTITMLNLWQPEHDEPAWL